MKIELEIKQKHIDEGVRQNPLYCPISLALEELFGSPFTVGGMTFTLRGLSNINFLGSEAQRFVRKFDLYKEVEPTKVHVTLIDSGLIDRVKNGLKTSQGSTQTKAH